MSIATVMSEGKFFSARNPHYCGLFNTAESAGEHAVLNGADGYVVVDEQVPWLAPEYRKNFYSAAILDDGHLSVIDTFFTSQVDAEEQAAKLNAKPDVFGNVDPSERWVPVIYNREMDAWQSLVEHEVYLDMSRALTKPSVGE